MKRAMIITVGSGPGVENAIVYSIKHHNPNLVAFCCSDKTVATVEKIKEMLNDVLPEDHFLTFESSEVNDFENIYDTYYDYIQQIKQRGYSSNEIVADYTSGTKAMSASLATAGIVSGISSLSYVYSNNRDETYGRSITGGMKVSSLRPNLIYSKQQIDLARKFFNKHQFLTVIDLLADEIHPKFKTEAQWLSDMAMAYNAWDKFNFELSKELFVKILEHPYELVDGFKETIIQHKKLTGRLFNQCQLYADAVELTFHTEKMAEEKLRVLNDDLINDLISNAERRGAEGKYDDAVARLYRALELMAQVLFAKKTGFVNSKTPLDHLPVVLQQHFKDIVENGKISIGLTQTFAALSLLENNEGKSFTEKKTEWVKVLEKRNSSILAHGLRPVRKEDYFLFLEEIKKLMPGYSFTEWPRL